MYKKLLNNTLERSQIEILHTGRAHKYGHAHLGPKRWYREISNISEKLKIQAERRKFRMGSKGSVDCVNQLNI